MLTGIEHMKKILLSLLLVPLMASAWEPTASKPITVIIGNQPGSGNEIGFRAISAVVQKNNPNANFVIELKPGGDSVVSMNILYDAKPDGYTIAIPSHMSTYVTNDIWQKKVKKFEYNSFSSALSMGQSPLTIVANPKSKVNTVSELITLLQTTDRPVTFALGGGAHRMTYEFIKFHGKANSNVDFVNFPGPLQAVTSVASESGTEFGIMPIAIALPLVQAGKVKVIGITGNKRLDRLPSAEPIVVAGKHISVMAAWTLTLPPNTPTDIVEWYTREFAVAIRSPEVKKYYEDNLISYDPKQLNPQGFDQHVIQLRKEYMPLAAEIKITD
jgi:tripartite-type tricarboxylate transporter receptor subunit TctC